MPLPNSNAKKPSNLTIPKPQNETVRPPHPGVCAKGVGKGSETVQKRSGLETVLPMERDHEPGWD